MTTRNLEKLCTDALDILVIGGGVHGAAIIYHLAKAGYRTAIVEKNDFGGATSANSLKILHGGLRYLQHLNIKRMRHSITSRREMMQMAPHLVEPLACMMPLYGNGLRGKMVMQTALFLNDCIGWDRNRDLPASIRLPRGRIVSKQDCLDVIPGLETEDLHGGSVWYDALAVNTERLVLEYILKSTDYGAGAVNYAQVTGVEKGENDIYLVTIRDNLSQEEYQLQTRSIVNASGPWFENLLHLAAGERKKRQAKDKQKWALALNIVSRKKIFPDYAVALEGQSRYEDKDAIIKRGKRLYFFVPWRGRTMIGTEYEETATDPDSLQMRREIIQNMVDEVNTIYPPAALTYEDISFYHAGLLPMRSESEQGAIQLEKNSTFYAHGDIYSRVLSVKGVKYTTAPHIAHEIVQYFTKNEPGQYMEPSVRSAAVAPQWNPQQSQLKDLLEKRYGQRAAGILAHMQEGLEDEIWLDEAAGLLKAEVKYLIEEEMACTLSDIVFRRTGLGTAECPGRELLTKLSGFMGKVLGWDEAVQAEEVEKVLQRYAPLHLKETEVNS